MVLFSANDAYGRFSGLSGILASQPFGLLIGFPTDRRIGLQLTSKRYAIKSLEEARAYLDHPVLGPRLLECMEAVLRVEERTAKEIFGSPDDLKLRSCATLFACVQPAGSVIDRLLAKYYEGEPDTRTLQDLGIKREAFGISRPLR